MALAYLLDPFLQYQNRAGVNNVGGYIEVFRMDTDDRATVYVDFNGTLAPEHIGIDNDGYAVMIAESGIPYRVEIHGPNGDLYKTLQPVWTVASGGGASGTDIVSSDGSIAIDQTSVGSLTTYDLSSHVEDGTDLLEWIKTEGYTAVSGNMIPTYQAGSMEVYPDGIRLYGNRYYHLTGRVKAIVHTLQPSYNEFKILVRGWDGESYTTYLEMPCVIDGSMGSTQEWEFSTDIMPSADSDISVTVSGLDTANNSVGLLDMEVHRVYSGAPYIPGSVASRPWVEENFQEKLTAGEGIEIDENNVISSTAAEQQQADWDQTDDTAVDFIKHKPDLSQFATTTDLAGKADKVSGATAGDIAVLDANGNITDTGVSATNLVHDSNYVHTDNNFTDADAAKLTGIETGAEVNVQPNWNETDTSSDAYIANKPANLVQDSAYVHTDNNFTDADKTKLSGIAAGAEVNVQADWNVSDSSSDAFIKNKPTIPPAVTVDQTYNSSSTNAQSGTAVAGAISNINQVPSSTSGDTGKVLTVDSQGNPGWANAQAPISAGNGIDITSNTVSAKVDGSTITFNANGEMVASGGGGSSYTAGSGIDITNDVISVDIGTATAHDIVSLQSDGTITDSGVSVINLVHDANYVHTDNNYTNADASKLSGIAAGAEVNVQSDWNQTDNLADDYIKNKPSIPVVPTLKPVVAGANITITENTNDVTISAAGGATYTAGNGINISGANAISIDTTVVATQSDLPVIGTITL